MQKKAWLSFVKNIKYIAGREWCNRNRGGSGRVKSNKIIQTEASPKFISQI